MTALLQFIFPLSVVQTAVLALAVAAAVALSPWVLAGTVNLFIYIVRRTVEVIRCCRECDEYDSEWMDAAKYEELTVQ